MRLGLVMAMMHVMGRLGIWEPYLSFVQRIIDALDRACEEAWDYVWWGDILDDLEADFDEGGKVSD